MASLRLEKGLCGQTGPLRQGCRMADADLSGVMRLLVLGLLESSATRESAAVLDKLTVAWVGQCFWRVTDGNRKEPVPLRLCATLQLSILSDMA